MCSQCWMRWGHCPAAQQLIRMGTWSSAGRKLSISILWTAEGPASSLKVPSAPHKCDNELKVLICLQLQLFMHVAFSVPSA